MSAILLIVCVASFLWWMELAAEWASALKGAAGLAELKVPDSSTAGLSVIIPARNEERTLEQALTSVLSALPFRGEAILVNDRSTDGTLEIAHKLASSDHRLKVVDITDLPGGWLGKNHAMWQGYLVSKGGYLLFTDADVIFEQDCLVKAISLCEEEGLDHLVSTPTIITRGFWERIFVPIFAILLMSRFRIWRAANPQSRFYAGIGAFNLVRRTVYELAGTHEALKGEAVDDLYLGRLMKSTGGLVKVVSGAGCLRVRWNIGLRGLMEGLEKNAFAAFGYSLIRVVGGCLILPAATLGPALVPFSCILFGGSRILWFAALAGLGVWCSFAVLYRLASYATGDSWLYFTTFPVGVLLMIWTILRSAVLYHMRGGIKWRGTVYERNANQK